MPSGQAVMNMDFSWSSQLDRSWSICIKWLMHSNRVQSQIDPWKVLSHDFWTWDKVSDHSLYLQYWFCVRWKVGVVEVSSSHHTLQWLLFARTCSPRQELLAWSNNMHYLDMCTSVTKEIQLCLVFFYFCFCFEFLQIWWYMWSVWPSFSYCKSLLICNGFIFTIIPVSNASQIAKSTLLHHHKS